MADDVVAAAPSSSPSTQGGGGGGGIHVVAKNEMNSSKQFSSALVPVAVLLAVVVGAVSLLPSLAQAVWEVPHLFLLGLVVSYGVFAQKISTGGSGGGGGGDDGARAWNSRYLSDDPLVVVADNAASDDDDGGGASGRPLCLPVRRLKPPPPAPTTPGRESEAGDASDDGIGAETDSSASTAGFWGTGPSPPSVLDAVCRSRKPTATATAAAPSAMSKGFPSYISPEPRRDQSFSDDGEVTDWDNDDDDEEDDVQDEMAASPQRSYVDHVDYNGDGDELSELAAEAAAEVEDEVDRKADEFIAKFREQIRLQRL
uniref:DUF4408 domain-containing protein n=1 Tax=Oryza meridionalis TaxID=40149 RepID=A0A0E0CPA3_9ORYZ